MKKLTIDNFQTRVHMPEKEHDVLEYWDAADVFKRSVEERPESKRYVFYDGPPFATGLPHYGHILASTIKDVVPRYWTMKGYRVDRIWGWDCHGIPIENMIEKELDLKGGKKGIEAMGIDKFNAACRSAIFRFDTEWEKVIRRIGRWVDFKHSYKTMDASYMESVWWAFKTLYDKGEVYEGKRVILYCPRCATPLSNFEIAMDNSYKELNGPSTTYKYKVKGEKDTYLLAWSTTPWNKLATPALAVHPTLEYVWVRQGNERYILAKSRLMMLSDAPYTVEKSMTGKALEAYEFELHYDFYPRKNGERAGVVVADEYVTDSEGTGIVTLAIYGEDDYRVMTKHHIQFVEHVDSEGMLRPEVKPWGGMFMLKVNPLVNEDLKNRGLIYHDEIRLHSVPVCYRCETRLYHAPVPAWFIHIQHLKQKLLDQNEHINWYPDHLKKGRFGKGLETAPDWNISRSRYWGTPMPVWKSDDGTMRLIGSREELRTWAVNPGALSDLSDIHREFLDDIEVWVDDKKTKKGRRIPEVFDCWVESGSMPYASIHYPFENTRLFEQSHPAQFIAEYIAQTRAWFYTLHVMSVGLFGKNTFENAVTTGTILAEDGNKMSKSKKNYPDPTLLFEKYGVDALRFYLMGSVVMKAENLNFSEVQVAEIYQKVIQILWNTFSFFKMYTNVQKVPKHVKPIHVMDRWLVSRTQNLILSVTEHMDAYDTIQSCREMTRFINDLSTWYLRRSRDRLKTDTVSQEVFAWAIRQTVCVMAPITPFISELITQNLEVSPESVHLMSWPEYDAALRNEQLEKDMDVARLIVEKIHSDRKEKNIPVRQPLGVCTVTMKGKKLTDEIVSVIKDEVNIKKVEFASGDTDIRIELDTTLTQELKDEGRARELIRKIQSLRKEKGLAVDTKIPMVFPEEFRTLPEELLADVKQKTLVESVVWGNTLEMSTG